MQTAALLGQLAVAVVVLGVVARGIAERIDDLRFPRSPHRF